MEAGYDYLLLRGRLQRRIARFTGIFLLVFGLLLLASGGAYYGYAAKARSGLDDLNANAGAARTPPQPFSRSVIPEVSLYPGDSLAAPYWTEPDSYEPAALREAALLRQFSPLAPGQNASASAPLDPATRIIIPSIDIDSAVTELAILDLGDSRTYETPRNVVGHIPQSSNAGEQGDPWYFGHTESPLRREGSVFFNLQMIPEKLKKDEEVYIITDNGLNRFLYRVTSTEVVHQDDLRLTQTNGANINLVSCVPRLVYDHRLVVRGELIAQQ